MTSLATLTKVEGTHKAARIAVVHDWLANYVGGERVLEQILSLYKDADLLTSLDILPAEMRGFLQGRQPITTFAQHFSPFRAHYRNLLPILMLAIEQLDVSSYDLVLSSSASIGKGVITGPDQLHIAYVHSPMRYAWDLQHDYLRDANLTKGIRGLLARWLLHKARLWDMRTANGVDRFIANSEYIAKRIWKVYRRSSTVIYPPVDTERFVLRELKEEYYLAASRLVPYKKMLEIVRAFAFLPHRRLVVIGDGPQMRLVKASAGKNVEVLGFQPFESLLDHMQRAKALLFAAEEDFGIAPVEAQACGTPVIAYARGGAAETIRGSKAPKPTGLFFNEQTPEAIAAAVSEFEERGSNIDPRDCSQNASRFSISNFRHNYTAFVAKCWEEYQSGNDPCPEESAGLLSIRAGRSA